MFIKKQIQILFITGSMLITGIDPAFSQDEVFRSKDSTKEIITLSQKIDTLQKKTFSFDKSEILFSCNFLAGRLNDVFQKNDSTYTVIISAENYPINPSPWYAFYMISQRTQKIIVELTYTQSKHRYYPKISTDGKNWRPVDSSLVQYIQPGKEKFGTGSMPASANVTVNLNKGDTIWLAAQEITSSVDVYNWLNELPRNKKIKNGVAAHSTYGKEVRYFSIGKIKKNKPSIVIISRQHPPEVTGYFAMQQFVNVLLSNEKQSRKYRRKFVTYVIPLMNPDGVDNGHWRHNAGGIDLNRDWLQQNQPEIKQVNHFFDSTLIANHSNILFFIDFHSTWDDIFYTNSVTKKSNLPGLMNGLLLEMETALQQGKLNIRASEKNESYVSKGYFYNIYNAEAVTYEVGDNTNRAMIERKGKVAAQSFLKTLFKLYK